MVENLLVTTQWLADHLHDDKLRIVDVRGRVLPATEPPPHYFSHHADYSESHIPGAVFVDWTTDIVEPDSPTYDIASPARYAALMSQLGIGDDTQVVAYDDANGMFAARFWWTLQYYGHEAAAVLDGGWQKWLAESRTTSAEMPVIQTTTFTPRIREAWRTDAEDIQASGQTAVLIDVRSPKEFAGEASRAKRMGHIPGAVNLPRKTLLAEDGTLLPADEIRNVLIDAGIKVDVPQIVLYCNSGVSASFGLLALRVIGCDGGSVYDSSWKEWGNNPDLPIA